MKENSHVISIRISDYVFKSLKSVGNKWKHSPDCIASIILSTLFEKTYNSCEEKKKLINRYVRRKTCIPCVLKFTDNMNNITCKTGHIIDISLGGVGVAIDADASPGPLSAYSTDTFEVIMQLEGEDSPSAFTCRSCYALKGSPIKLGGQLLNPDTVFFMHFIKAFVRANHMRTCRAQDNLPASPR